jgi:hypothetical protein
MEISRASRPPILQLQVLRDTLLGRTVSTIYAFNSRSFLFSPMKTVETVDAIKNSSRDPKLKLGENEKLNSTCTSNC